MANESKTFWKELVVENDRLKKKRVKQAGKGIATISLSRYVVRLRASALRQGGTEERRLLDEHQQWRYVMATNPQFGLWRKWTDACYLVLSECVQRSSNNLVDCSKRVIGQRQLRTLELLRQPAVILGGRCKGLWKINNSNWNMENNDRLCKGQSTRSALRVRRFYVTLLWWLLGKRLPQLATEGEKSPVLIVRGMLTY